MGDTRGLLAWLSTPQSVEERRARIAGYLANEGYELPPPPRDADYDEAGATHWIRGQEMTVAYSVVDQGGRRVYHYVEHEVDHILLRRIERSEEWAIEHLASIPSILKRGLVSEEEFDRVVYLSRRTYLAPAGRRYRIRVIVQQTRSKRWYVATLHPRWKK